MSAPHRPDRVAPERLGRLVREFRAATVARMANAGLITLGAVLCGVVAAGITRTDDYAWWHVALPGALGAYGVIYGMVLLGKSIRNAGEAVLLYDHGLVHRTRRGDEVFTWQEIDCVWQKITRFRNGFSQSLTMDNTDREYIVDCRDGRRLVMMEFVGMKELGPAVAEAVARRWFPWTIGEIDDGHQVWLGQVGLSQAGLHYRDRVVPWGRATVGFNQGMLVVAGRPWLPAHKIPNLALLVAVAHHLRARDGAHP